MDILTPTLLLFIRIALFFRNPYLHIWYCILIRLLGPAYGKAYYDKEGDPSLRSIRNQKPNLKFMGPEWCN
jgi:hypothetical protein